jgi:flagellin
MAITFNSEQLSAMLGVHTDRATRALTVAIERLSSGRRINHASDDAAGLAIATKLAAQARSLGQASRNASDGISMIQVAEGGYEAINDALGRMRSLAVQSANGTVTNTDRATLNTEYQDLKAEIDRIAKATTYGDTRALITAAITLAFQVGTNAASAVNMIKVSTTDVNTTAIGGTNLTSSSINSTKISTAGTATTAITLLDKAITQIGTARAKLGAGVARLNAALDFVTSARSAVMGAESRIMDADVAMETAIYAKNQILTQAGVALRAQANLQPQLALALIRG